MSMFEFGRSVLVYFDVCGGSGKKLAKKLKSFKFQL